MPGELDSRVVIALDLDYFYAQVHEICLPGAWRERGEAPPPIGVKQKHIIVTANYPARARGVSKLQLLTDAVSKCPELIVIDGSDLCPYRAKSAEVEAALKHALKCISRLENSSSREDTGRVDEKGGYNHVTNGSQVKPSRADVTLPTPTKTKSVDLGSDVSDVSGANMGVITSPTKFNCIVQRLGMDEWFVDITSLVKIIMKNKQLRIAQEACTLSDDRINVVAGNKDNVPLRFKVGLCIASHLRRSVLESSKLTCSAGVSSSKMLAKISVNHRKPNGESLFLPSYARKFMSQRCVRVVPGCGYRYAKRLRKHLRLLGFNYDDNRGHSVRDNIVADMNLNGDGIENASTEWYEDDTEPISEYEDSMSESAYEAQRRRQADRIISTSKNSFPQCQQVVNAFLNPSSLVPECANTSSTNTSISAQTSASSDGSVVYQDLVAHTNPRIGINKLVHTKMSICAAHHGFTVDEEPSLPSTGVDHMSTSEIMRMLDVQSCARVLKCKYGVAEMILMKCLGVCTEPVLESRLPTVISVEDSMRKNTFKTKLEVRAKMLKLVDSMLLRMWKDVVSNNRIPSTLFVRFRNSGVDDKKNKIYQNRQTGLPQSEFGSVSRMLELAKVALNCAQHDDKNFVDSSTHASTAVRDGSEKPKDMSSQTHGATSLKNECNHLRFVLLREAMSLIMKYSLVNHDPESITNLAVGVSGFKVNKLGGGAGGGIESYMTSDMVDEAEGNRGYCCPICEISFVGMLNTDIHYHLDACVDLNTGNSPSINNARVRAQRKEIDSQSMPSPSGLKRKQLESTTCSDTVPELDRKKIMTSSSASLLGESFSPKSVSF
eukprot:CFRG4043T1